MKLKPIQLRKRLNQRGYIMLVAMILLALLAVIGTSTMNIAGIDQRIAYRNRQHAVVVHTSHAGTEQARDLMRDKVLPSSEGFNQYGIEDTGLFITKASGESDFGGVAYHTASGVHNLGVYTVDAVYLRCGNPPPGYSTEQGRNGFRSDYWAMESIATMTETCYISTNASKATITTMIRMVMRGGCKVR
jgi:hypothetical protein